MAVTDKWDAHYAAAETAAGEAAWVLREYAHLLPTPTPTQGQGQGQGQALDLACGLGANALYLAGHGLQVSAWDSSAQAIARLQAAAHELGLALTAAVRDVVAQPPEPASLDVIVVAHFLERRLFPALIAALRPGGLLFYQTFTTQRVDGQSTPSNPDFLLAPNELLELCQPLRVLAYREDGLAGDLTQGMRARAACVGMQR
ncbi:MAG: methyltransferase domain-containing protein [Halothiobacillaceae bacterium]|nr:methyltransferase domain-containing protein [Halothiobacillaceae bacterium]